MEKTAGVFSIRLCDAVAKEELKSHVIVVGGEQRKYFEGRPQQEYHVRVQVAAQAYNNIPGWVPGDQISASVLIDGKKTGSSHKLTAGVEKTFDYLVSAKGGQSVKHSLVFVEPQLEQFWDENEAKANIEANKSSPVGSIVCEFWHTRKKSGTSRGHKYPAKLTAKVKDTKKFTDRASIGTQAGRFMGVRSCLKRISSIAKLGEQKIWIHTPLMCQFLKGLDLRDNSTAKSSSSSASLSSFSSSSSASSSSSPSSAAPMQIIEIPDDVPPPPAIVIEIKDEPDAKRHRVAKQEPTFIDLTSDN